MIALGAVLALAAVLGIVNALVDPRPTKPGVDGERIKVPRV